MDSRSRSQYRGGGLVSDDGGIDLTKVFPVGSLYMTVEEASPAEHFGGSWSLFAPGRTLVGVNPNDTDFSTAMKTGGEKVHTLSLGEIPSHTHSTIVGTGSGPYSYNVQGLPIGVNNSTPITGSTGGGGAHNNLQPYITCYIWRRIA